MRIQQPSACLLVMSSLFLCVSCSWLTDQSSSPAVELPPSKSLAGLYKDVGPNGSIKPHSQAPHTMRGGQRTEGVIELGDEIQNPELDIGTFKKGGTSEWTRPPGGAYQ